MEQQGMLTENRQQKRWVEEIDQKNAEIDRLRMHLRFVQPQIHRLQAEVALKTQQVIGLDRDLEAARQEIEDVIDSKNREIAAIKSDGHAATRAEVTKYRIISELERVIEDLKAGKLDMKEESEERFALVEADSSSPTIEDTQALEGEKTLLRPLAIPGFESRAYQLLELEEPLENVGKRALGTVSKCVLDASLYHPQCPVPRPDLNMFKALYGTSHSYVWVSLVSGAEIVIFQHSRITHPFDI
jgi:chromosome segregation ATPase